MFEVIGDYSPAILVPSVIDLLKMVWVYSWLERHLILFIYRMFLCHVFHLEYMSGLLFSYPLQVACTYKEGVWEYYNIFVVVLSLVVIRSP